MRSWGHKADGGRKASVVAVSDEFSQEALGIREIERGEGTDDLVFEGLVEAFEFTLGRGVEGDSHEVGG